MVFCLKESIYLLKNTSLIQSFIFSYVCANVRKPQHLSCTKERIVKTRWRSCIYPFAIVLSLHCYFVIIVIWP